MIDSRLPRAIAFDVDNTLVESKQPITHAMATLVSDLAEKTNVAIITGGKFELIKNNIIDEFPPKTNLSHIFILPTCGAAMYQFQDGEWVCVYEERIPESEVARLEEAIETAAHGTGLVDFSAPSYGERIEFRGSGMTLSALGQQAPLEEKKAWDPDRVKRPILQQAIAKVLPEYDVKVGGTTSIDITKKGINKAYGVRELARELHLSITSDMLYVGDELMPGGNDEVVREAGIKTHQVTGPADTAKLIKALLAGKPIEEDENSPLATTEVVSATPASSSLVESLRKDLQGDVDDALEERARYSHDTSLFARTPSLVVYPKNPQDVVALVKDVRAAKEHGEDVSVTARSAGTDMSGGPLTTSVVAVFTKYMNKIISIKAEYEGGYAVTEPGVYYRDFEKETLKHNNLLLPSYPASRELCAMGGIVNNNSGGERTLEYGKTEKYVEEVEVVLSDGTLTTFKALTKDELEAKKQQKDFEGELYRKMHALLTENAETIKNAKPKVSKNSAGYALWNVIDEEKGTFNLAKLICGAQGTLALMTKAKLRLVKDEPRRAMLVIFLSDISILPEIVNRVLPFNPESFESYDDQTFKLAVRFLFPMLSQMGIARAVRLGFSFLPEVGMVLSGGIPKLVLMAEFSEDTIEMAESRVQQAYNALKPLGLRMSIKKNEKASEKYWIVRRESFALLRKNVHGLYASPFIDDFVVPPACYPKFLPELNALLGKYKHSFIYTIAGHIGNGNFHIIPLMDLKKPETRKVVLDLAPEVYNLVIKYGGTTTGEHNDGIIRTPYLEMLFGPKMTALFAETKKIFDPLTIFNPGKKVGGTFKDIERDMLKSS